MSLIELIDNSKTDKNTLHSYIELYEKLLCSQKETAKNVLEVGIYNGGSIKLWRDYFVNAQVYALDIIHENKIWDKIKNDQRITLYTSTDAYNDNIFKTKFLDTGLKFDFMLDDGPHTLDSMIKFIKLYSQIMTEKGILIIEDVQSIEWIDKLKETVSPELQQYIKVYDLRQNKNRYDDIVFTIDKQNL
jgi:cephalosporin hydroxylase